MITGAAKKPTREKPRGQAQGQSLLYTKALARRLYRRNDACQLLMPTWVSSGLPNLHLNGMVAGCAIGNSTLLLARLNLPGSISGSRSDSILSPLERLPLPCPENPGIL